MKQTSVLLIALLLSFFMITGSPAQELIGDPHFQDGLRVITPNGPPDSIDGNIGFDTTKIPVWTCGQWNSQSSLTAITPVVLDNGWYQWKDDYKEVRLGPYGAEEYDILLGANSVNEWDSTYRQAGEPWPHLLVEERLSPPGAAGPGCPSMDIMDSLHFHVEACLTQDTTIKNEGYDPNIHAAQFLIYFTVQNLNRSSAGYGKEYIWLGIQVYDDRYEHPPEYINKDDGTQTLIYSLAYDSVATVSTHTHEWVAFDVDLYPYALKALDEAWRQGYLPSSHDLADYKLGGMNMGWELPGMNIVTMEVRHLSLIAHTAPEGVKDPAGDKNSITLFPVQPNPSGYSTMIRYRLAERTKVELKIYNMDGKEMNCLVQGIQEAGEHAIHFDTSGLAPGLYLCRLTAEHRTATTRLMIGR